MALNSYKQWKMVNESFGALGPINLGFGRPQSIGITGSQFEIDNPEGEELEEAKSGSKKSKKMDADIEITDEDPKNRLVKKLGNAKKDIEKVDDEVEDDELDDSDDDDDDEDEELDDSDDDGDDIPDDEEDKDPDITKRPMLMKKKMKKGMKKAMKKSMKKEDRDWWNSVHNMVLSEPESKSWDGFSRIKEDALLPPVDSNKGLGDAEPEMNANPGPGEVGYAPQTRFGF